MRCLAYLITFRTYGSWLPGDERGFIDHARQGRSASQREAHAGLYRVMKELRKHDTFVMDASCRAFVEQAIREACEFRQWAIAALCVRTNHIHLVISAPVAPEVAMRVLKARATRQLRERFPQLRPLKLWAEHGSTRYLNDERAFHDACRYVSEGQGDDIPV